MVGHGLNFLTQNLTRPELYTQKIGFDPIQPDHVSGHAQEPGTGRKSINFFLPDPNPDRSDK